MDVSEAAIHLNVDDTRKLFHSLDPSPLIGRHLDESVERFIVHSATERPSARHSLVVHSVLTPSGDEQEALAAALRKYFAHRSREESARIDAQVKDGAQALIIGLVFLFICGVAGLLALTLLPRAVGLFIEQGLLIIGWVALWRPVDLFLYELRPLRKQRDILEALRSVEVQFETTKGSAAPNDATAVG